MERVFASRKKGSFARIELASTKIFAYYLNYLDAKTGRSPIEL